MKVNKVALITGGAQGIGRAIAKKFLENNIAVIIADNDEEAGNELQHDPQNDLCGK